MQAFSYFLLFTMAFSCHAGSDTQFWDIVHHMIHLLNSGSYPENRATLLNLSIQLSAELDSEDWDQTAVFSSLSSKLENLENNFKTSMNSSLNVITDTEPSYSSSTVLQHLGRNFTIVLSIGIGFRIFRVGRNF